MVLPIVIITTAEALRAVPQEHPRGRLRRRRDEVGGRPVSHVLPNAAPGILTGSVLSMARALGETAPLIMVGAVTGFLATQGGLLEQLQQRFTSLPTLDLRLRRRSPSPTSRSSPRRRSWCSWSLIFLVNLAAILLRNRYERKW